jgi:putative thioredoxin
LQQLDQALALAPKDDLIMLDRAQALLLLERYDEARAALSNLSVLAAEDDRAKRMVAELEIAAGAAAVEDAHGLQARVGADPQDFEARLALADWHAGRREFEPALDLLLEVVQRDRKFGDDAARKKMLAVFGLLGNSGELVDRYRRRLAAALNR